MNSQKTRLRTVVFATASVSGLALLALFALLAVSAVSEDRDATFAEAPRTIRVDRGKPTVVLTRSQGTVRNSLRDASVAPVALAEMSMSGEITSIGDRTVTFKDSDLKEHTVTVDDATTYTLDGQEALFSSLKKGQSVNVIVTQDGDNWLARSVTATSRTKDLSTDRHP